MEASEQEVLAKIRTLLALERNILAEERTALAEFRTGLALALIAPTASTVVVYLFSALPIEKVLPPSPLHLINFTFFSILTIFGIWTSFRSGSKLRKIRKRKKIIKDREVAITQSSKAIHDLLCECIDLDEGV